MIRSLSNFLSVSLATLLMLSVVGEPAFSKECDRKPSTCLRKYIKDKQYVDASNLYNENREFFRTPKESRRHASELQELTDVLNQQFSAQIQALQPQMISLDFDPTDSTNWSELDRTLSEANGIYKSYVGHKILFEEKYQLPIGLQFVEDFKSKVEQIGSQRVKAISAYDHGSRESFFDLYPFVAWDDVGRRMTVNKAWPNLRLAVDSLGMEGLLYIMSSWTDGVPAKFEKIFGQDKKSYIEKRYFDILLREITSGRESSFDYVITSLDDGLSNKVRLPASMKPKLGLLILDSSKNLEIEFEQNTFARFETNRSIPNQERLDFYDLLMVLAITNTEITEETLRTGSIDSTYEVGKQTMANPDYTQAQSAYEIALNSYAIADSAYGRAEATYSACQARTSYCLAEAYLAGTAQRERQRASEALSGAQNRLSRSNQYTAESVYQPYSFSVSTIQLAKEIEGYVAMISSFSNDALVAPFKQHNEEVLRIAVGVHATDAEAVAMFKSPSDLAAAEKIPAKLLIRDVFRNLDSTEAQRQKTGDRASFLATLSQPERKDVPAIAAETSLDQMSVTRAAHPAINGVVVVRPPLGGIGTGFFVAPSLILTNYHVVANSNFVQLELADGRSATGRIVNYDINRDLALVRTDIEGQPLELFSGHTLPLGESVIAIGHPSGLTFTVTKGIISAVREQKTASSMGLGAEYLFVQTDTAISPGNSGGPLLLNNKVIGINTEKLVDVEIEGVGFALHYAEIAHFLATSMSN